MSRRLFRVLIISQVWLGFGFASVGLLLPPYIYMKFALESHPVFDRNSNSYYQGNYLLLSIALGGICVLVGLFSAYMGRRELKKMAGIESAR